jgi:hypothetical protein
MKNKFRNVLILFLVGWSANVVCATAGASSDREHFNKSHFPQSVPSSNTERGLETDERTFENIFKGNYEESVTELSESRERFSIEFAYSSLGISDSKVVNDYYSLNLKAQVDSISMFRINADYEVWRRGALFLSPGIGLGYAFQERILEAEGISGGSYKDAVRLKLAPLSTSIKFGRRFSIWGKPVLFSRLGIKYEWLAVSGALDGITQSYWHLGYNAGIGISLFESDPNILEYWFGGFALSTGISRPFSPRYSGISSNYIDFAVRFLL